MASKQVFRIPPNHYVHVTDQNTNVTRVVCGPLTYVCQDHETVIAQKGQKRNTVQVSYGTSESKQNGRDGHIRPMIIVPSFHYCVISNPHRRSQAKQGKGGKGGKSGARDDGNSGIVVSEEGFEPLLDDYGQIQLFHGKQEVRLHQKPFPLYPGEAIDLPPTRLVFVDKRKALRLRCMQDFDTRHAGQEWLFEGPGYYIPNVNVEICIWAPLAGGSQLRNLRGGFEWRPLNTFEKQQAPTKYIISAHLIREHEVLKVRATQDMVDRDGNQRKAGEEWTVQKLGYYMPGVFEQAEKLPVGAYTLTDTRSYHFRAARNFTDQFGTDRFTGDEWLITKQDCETYIPSVHEKKIRDVNITVLSSREYAVICNPYNGETKKNDLGGFRLVKGERSFFLHPGETLQGGRVQKMYILNEEQGLILRANERFEDEIPAGSDEKLDEYVTVKTDGKDKQGGDVGGAPNMDRAHSRMVRAVREPGDKWMIRGPMEYIPPIQATVIKEVEALSLDKNEGVYVRDLKTGKVKSVIGQTYMLNENEELWEKELPDAIERLLAGASSILDDEKSQVRDKTKLVTYHIPHNSAGQIFDYKQQKARLEFGPTLVMLGPDEMFTPLSLSGGKPKVGNAIRSLHLMLGPDFSTDIIVVETSDHARLRMKLSYNWKFDISRFKTKQEAIALFSVADFVGDMCNAMASRVRAAVASVPFDEFHLHSAIIIRKAVFGEDEKTGDVRDEFEFPANGLIITEIDIKEIEPVDDSTKHALQRSVNLAIEIMTESQESTAAQEAKRQEQEAKGKLNLQTIADDCESAQKEKDLLDIKAEALKIKQSGSGEAKAQALANACEIQIKAKVDQAALLEKAEKIIFGARLRGEEDSRQALLDYSSKKYALVENYHENMSGIEFNKFSAMITAIGAETLQSIALSGPELQVSLLQGLGLNSTLIMDGTNPLNLFNTAQQLIAKTDTTVGSNEDEKNNGPQRVPQRGTQKSKSRRTVHRDDEKESQDDVQVDQEDEAALDRMLNGDLDVFTNDINWNESDDDDDDDDYDDAE